MSHVSGIMTLYKLINHFLKDFGINELEKLVTRLKRNFPWLLSNFYQKDSSLKIPMAPGKEYHTLEINGIKVNLSIELQSDRIYRFD